MKVNDLGEFALISRLTASGVTRSARIVRGIGDDAAVFHHGSDRLVLATTDAQIEGIHFTREGFTPEQIGERASAVNLSDIAAMGGRPLFALVSLAIPSDTPVDFLESIYVGLRRGFQRVGAEIIGGNTAELPTRLLLDVTVLGEVSENQLLRRDTACPGDVLCVTGEIGKSAAGLILQSQPHLIDDAGLRERALLAHCVPTPRVGEGLVLGQSGKVTACIDISDGLLGDARHIARQSEVGVEIELTQLPVAREATAVAEKMGKDSRVFALTGGEDFELMFTVNPASVSDVFSQLRDATGCSARAIGKITGGMPEVCLTENGARRIVSETGFRHFRNGKK